MKTVNRRAFVRVSGQTASLAALAPTALQFLPDARAQSPADKVVLALIGAGGRGSGLAANFAQIPGVEFKLVCDPNRSRAESAAQTLTRNQPRPPTPLQDLRRVFEDKDVNGVVIATPEHWHGLGTVWACQAGKDVYVEKNTSLRLVEGRRMIEAARKYQRIVQVGFQNRSAPYAVSARDYLRSGKLGKVVLVKVFNLLEGGPWKPQPDAATPATLDWDLWLGPAPEVPYNPGRHNGWNDWWDYCAGAFSGDASHQLDLTRMVLGDPPAPRTVVCAGGRLGWRDDRQIPDTLAVTYDYGDFVMTCENGTATPYMKKFPQEVRFGTQWPYWPQSSCRVEIYGTQQLMCLGRHGCGWQVFEAGGKVVAQDKGYFPDKWHQPNFIDCIRSRQQPNADIEQAHQSACLIHLGVASYRTGRRQLEFDPAQERFTNNDDANRLLQPLARNAFHLPDRI
jgi:predicted dehydrogenase